MVRRVLLAAAVAVGLGAAMTAEGQVGANGAGRAAGTRSEVGAIRKPETGPSPIALYAGKRVDGAMKLLGAGEMAKARAEAEVALTALAMYGQERDAEAFRRAAAVRRVAASLAGVEEESVRRELATYLVAHEEVARQVAYALPSPEKGKTAWPMMARLIKERAAVVERLPNLAAAIAVVHDEPLEKRVNENRVRAADPVAIMDYFAQNEGRMAFGVRGMPVDLLVYVVDTTSSIEDLRWALGKYQGNRNIGATFFNVRYDYNAFTLSREKDVTKQGYTLPNILRLGGVCADQAYFATEVAKAIGVPSAYTRAASAEVSHAWVGFLQSTGRQAWWNFETGRYESYNNVRGDVTDPVTREVIPDSFVALLAESISTTEPRRQAAAAYVDAAIVMMPSAAPRAVRQGPGGPSMTAAAPVAPAPAAGPADLAEVAGGAASRGRTAEGALALIEMGLRQAEAFQPGWTAVARLAATGQMTLDQKRRWADLVQKLCGRKYPDFALATLEPMIRSVEETAVQARLWDTLYGSFQGPRPDLAAMVRIRQGEMWEKAGDYARAGQAYEDVIRRYVNTSPHALTAVRKAEGVLRQMGQGQKVLVLYEQASKAVMRPASLMAGEFMRQSNWYKIKSAYAKKLEEAGRTEEAKRVMPDVGEAKG